MNLNRKPKIIFVGSRGMGMIYGYEKEPTLKKVDPNCVERYEYKKYPSQYKLPVHQSTKDDISAKIIVPIDIRTITIPALDIKGIEPLEKLKDKGCIKYSEVNNTSFFKCPLNNCKKKTITKKESGGLFLDYIRLQEIGDFNCKIKLILKGD